MPVGETLDHAANRLVARSEKIDSQPAPSGMSYEPLEKINASHALSERLAQQSRSPYDRHSVGCNEIGFGQNAAEQFVAVCRNDLSRVDDRHIMRLAISQKLINPSDRLALCQIINIYSGYANCASARAGERRRRA
jgi:hypothetical protein